MVKRLWLAIASSTVGYIFTTLLISFIGSKKVILLLSITNDNEPLPIFTFFSSEITVPKKLESMKKSVSQKC